MAPCATSRESHYILAARRLSYADRAGGVARIQKATSLKAVMPSAAPATGPAYTGLKAQTTMVCTCPYPTPLALQRTLSTTPVCHPLSFKAPSTGETHPTQHTSPLAAYVPLSRQLVACRRSPSTLWPRARQSAQRAPAPPW